MKHLFVIIFAALTCILGATELRIAPGVALRKRASSDFTYHIAGKKQGFSPTLSAQTGIELKGFFIGVGADWQSEEKVPKLKAESTPGKEIMCLPIYGMLCYVFPSEKEINPEMIVQAGISNNKWNDKWVSGNNENDFRADDGLFYALGMGLQRGKWTLHALYRVNTIPIHIEYYQYGELYDEQDLVHRISQINLSLGYQLKLHK